MAQVALLEGNKQASGNTLQIKLITSKYLPGIHGHFEAERTHKLKKSPAVNNQ